MTFADTFLQAPCTFAGLTWLPRPTRAGKAEEDLLDDDVADASGFVEGDALVLGAGHRPADDALEKVGERC